MPKSGSGERRKARRRVVVLVGGGRGGRSRPRLWYNRTHNYPVKVLTPISLSELRNPLAAFPAVKILHTIIPVVHLSRLFTFVFSSLSPFRSSLASRKHQLLIPRRPPLRLLRGFSCDRTRALLLIAYSTARKSSHRTCTSFTGSKRTFPTKMLLLNQ